MPKGAVTFMIAQPGLGEHWLLGSSGEASEGSVPTPRVAPRVLQMPSSAKLHRLLLPSASRSSGWRINGMVETMLGHC